MKDMGMFKASFNNVNLEIPVGAVCNNKCRFCMETNRVLRKERTSRFTLEVVEKILREHSCKGNVIFRTGEPTTNPHLMEMVRMAWDMGYEKIGIITNGRRLSDRRLCEALVDAGANNIAVSIHGPNADIHDSLTTRPGSFAESWQGALNLNEIKSERPELHFTITTVLNRVNIHFIREMMEKYLQLEISTLSFLALRIEGGNRTRYDDLIVPLDELSSAFRNAYDAIPPSLRQNRIILTGVPVCLMDGIEECWTPVQSAVVSKEEKKEETLWTMNVRNIKRPDCERCACNSMCPGLLPGYVSRFGWKAFVPVKNVNEKKRKLIFEGYSSPDSEENKDAEKNVNYIKEIKCLKRSYERKDIEETGKLAELAWRIGNIYLHLKNYEEAAEWQRKAVETEPFFLDAYLRLAETLLYLGHQEKARSALRDASSLPMDSKKKRFFQILSRRARFFAKE